MFKALSRCKNSTISTTSRHRQALRLVRPSLTTQPVTSYTTLASKKKVKLASRSSNSTTNQSFRAWQSAKLRTKKTHWMRNGAWCRTRRLMTTQYQQAIRGANRRARGWPQGTQTTVIVSKKSLQRSLPPILATRRAHARGCPKNRWSGWSRPSDAQL